MSEQEKANWLKIKKHFEEIGKTDNFFYERACVISDGGKDPMDDRYYKKD